MRNYETQWVCKTKRMRENTMTGSIVGEKEDIVFVSKKGLTTLAFIEEIFWLLGLAVNFFTT